MTQNKLSDSEEMLLMRFLDKETGLLEDRAVRKLLDIKPEARSFLTSIGAADHLLRSELSADLHCDSEMWERVSNRIKAEEKAEIFLGKRKAPAVLFKSRFDFDWRTWSAPVALAGTALAALLFVIVPNDFAKQGDKVKLGKGLDYMSASEELSSSPVQPIFHSNPFMPEPQVGVVSSSGLMSEEAPPSVLSGQRSAVPLDSLEVDWVRSHGRVKLIQDVDGRSAIVWIKKRDPLRGRSKEAALGFPSSAGR